ncbi:hypothetical protein TPHA_0M01680 [Tetrapisispora phaffii CBS 4417]|uniref:PX domain-containing protein n=1 Tax=Tetrapisispora phaffii (strain ATCC 24235 / CBS 4417 / NBRC 1672 / NRRL Y-8282 / UCD 70-5) TaxID=1071381 RepID=G8C0M8_TETPH|nr:hypothetical protein TPHA_0M01680 [Tetrapisispora phaffii CBS 4417]CCE65743.1 hypothetical protein TPHA_0M01680 [Tetrapisispora phaffii CBS 4417]
MEEKIITPVQEHYIKKELLKLELENEIALLDDPFALRKFGYPFCSTDPIDNTANKKRSSGMFSSTLIPNSPNYNGIKSKSNISLLSITSGDNGANKLANADVTSLYGNDSDPNAFNMLNYFLKEFIIKFPLLNNSDEALKTKFWQQKVQPFYEYFMSLPFSDSLDREKSSKRKMMSTVINKLVYSFFASNIITANESLYYTKEKQKYLEEQGIEKKSRLKHLGIGMPDTIRYLVTSEELFINNWNINIIGVLENNLKALDKIQKGQNKSSKLGGSKLSATSITSSFGMSSTKKWMKSALSVTSASSTAFISKITTGNSSVSPLSLMSKPTHYFILEVYNKNEHEVTHKYLQKSYYDFIEFSNILKKEFPAKKLPKLPHKQKATDTSTTSHEGIQTSTSHVRLADALHTGEQKPSIIVNDSEISLDKLNMGIDSAINDAHSEDINFEFVDDKDNNKNNSNLSRDITRTSFRQYLRKLTEDEEIAYSVSLNTFLNSNNVQLDSLPSEIQEDINSRKLVDASNLQDEVSNQEEMEETMHILSQSMSGFRSKLEKDDDYIKNIINEFKMQNEISLMSDDVQHFSEWLKLTASSVIYHLFLSKRGSRGLFNQVRMLHNLIPYNMMSQIMKVTNPMSIMKGMTDLFLSQPFGGYSLFQTMFITIITEDIRVQTKVIKKLEKKIIEESNGSQTIIDHIKLFVEKNQISNELSLDEIRAESQKMGMPMVLIVLMKYSQLRKVSQKDVDSVIESYTAWKVQNKSVGVVSESEKQESSYFANLKDLQKLYFKNNDKKLMKKVWQDPVLAQLLKAIVNLIYDPMVKLFNIADVDKGLKLFERFMTDLIKLVDKVVFGRLGTCTKFDVICRIKNLLDKYEDEFLSLLNHFLNNDKENVIEEYIAWVTSILNFLDNKNEVGKNNVLDIEKSIKESDILTEKLTTEIDDIMKNKFAKRKIFNDIVSCWKRKTVILAENSKLSDQDEIRSNMTAIKEIDIELGNLELLFNELMAQHLDRTELNSFREQVFVPFINGKYFG